ncbi:MAG: TonB-dependent receptor, partial [Acidobacteria bacterium]|nr:TonB-dependent receptor [Acidobacteriota bacterium]
YQIAGLTPGFKSTTIDVGGSTVGTGAGYRAYGRSGQVQFSLDGVNSTEGSNSASIYGDFGSYEEIQVSAAGNNAEMNSAGAQFVAVIRSGGNDIHSSVLFSYEDQNFQSDNLDDNLRRIGFTTPDRFTRLTEFNGDIGGPIKRDKLWYYSSYRFEYIGLQTQMRQNNGARYRLPASGIAPALCTQLPCVGDNPDGAASGADFYTHLKNLTVKLNYQINSNNQLITYANARHKYQPYRGGDGNNARTQVPDTTQIQDSWFHTWKGQWISTLTNRTTLDVSVNNFGYYWRNSAHVPNEPRIQDIGTSGASRGYLQGGFRADLNNRRRWHENIIISHFTNWKGAHNIKAGYALQWEDYRGSTLGYKDHVLYQFNNGVPDRIVVDNTPIQWRQNSLLQNYFYIQDKWTIGTRLTLNIGFRFDRYRNYLPEQVRESALGNPFNSANDITGLETFGNRRFEHRDIATFNNPVPRFAMVYDVFGNGRTALKASYGRFSNNPAEGLSSQAQDNAIRSATYSWNGTLPFTVDYLRSCMRSGACRVITQPNLTLTRIDPNIRNSYITEFTVGIDQQVFTDWNLRFDFVRKIDEGAYGNSNQNYQFTDYTPFQFRDPGRDGRAGTSDDAIVTAYNRAVATRPNNPLITYIDGAGDMFRTWEIAAVKRFSNKWQLVAGADWTKRDLGPNLFSRDPNTAINDSVLGGSHYWDWTGKIYGTYEAPYGIKLSSVYKSQNGEAHNRTIQVNCDRVVAPGQTCAQAGGRGPSQGSFNLTVENSGTGGNFLPTVHLIDFSVGKEFNLERWGKTTASFDLFNLTNANTIRGWTTTSATTSNPDGSIAPTFRRPSTIIPARIFRLTLKWDF